LLNLGGIGEECGLERVLISSNIYDKTNLKLINAIAFLATPSSSPFIGTPDLPSPIRQIILNDIESEPTESLDILPQMLGTDFPHKTSVL
jgi:hypothetical protein